MTSGLAPLPLETPEITDGKNADPRGTIVHLYDAVPGEETLMYS